MLKRTMALITHAIIVGMITVTSAYMGYKIMIAGINHATIQSEQTIKTTK